MLAFNYFALNFALISSACKKRFLMRVFFSVLSNWITKNCEDKKQPSTVLQK